MKNICFDFLLNDHSASNKLYDENKRLAIKNMALYECAHTLGLNKKRICIFKFYVNFYGLLLLN